MKRLFPDAERESHITYKEDGRIGDIAKLCIDKPDNGCEVVYVVEAWVSRKVEDLKIQEKEDFDTVDEAKEILNREVL
jgi:hypothetical protein